MVVLRFIFQTEILRIVRNVELLLVPEDMTETAKSLRGFADPRTDLQVRATVFLDDTSQILETGDMFNRGMVREKVDVNGLCTKTSWENCHGLGL